MCYKRLHDYVLMARRLARELHEVAQVTGQKHRALPNATLKNALPSSCLVSVEEGLMRARRPKGFYTGSGSTNLYLTIVFMLLYLQIMLFSFVRGLGHELIPEVFTRHLPICLNDLLM